MPAYSFSFIIDNEIHIQKFYLLSSYILSFGLPAFTLIKNSEKETKKLFSDNKFIFSINDIFPFSSFLIGMFRIFYNSMIKKLGLGFLFGDKKISFIILNHCALFSIQFVFYLFLLFLFEIRFFERIFICISNFICFRRTYSDQIDYNANNNQVNNNNRDIENLNNNIHLSL